jgi:drug/metabolite transporter (DMT)-like permease
MTNERRSWLLLIMLSLIWGSSFILMHKSMMPLGQEMVLGPFQVGALRIVIAGLVLSPFAIKHIRLLKTKIFWWLLIVGACGNLIPAFLFTLAETKIEHSLAGILNMGTSFFVVIIGIVIYKKRPTWLQTLGIKMGAFGLYQILKSELRFENEDLNYALLVLLATFCYGISLTTIKFKLVGVEPLVITSLSFFIILFPAMGVALLTNAFDPIVNHPDGLKSLGYLSILSVIGTALAVFVFTRLIAVSSHIFASGVTYLIPVVAVFIGQLSGQSFKIFNLIWVAIIIMGVYLMNKKSAIK